MRRHALVLAALTFATVGCAPMNDPAPKQPTDKEMMDAFAKASTPVEEHRLLRSYVGKWNHVVTTWMKPDGPPDVTKGATEIDSLFEGRFIRQWVSGSWMGRPFQGLGLTGYDTVQRQFQSVWLDSMGTAMMFATSQFHGPTNALVGGGELSCPLTPTGRLPYRIVWTLPRNDTFTYEMFSRDPQGKETRMMEIVYTRAR